MNKNKRERQVCLFCMPCYCALPIWLALGSSLNFNTFFPSVKLFLITLISCLWTWTKLSCCVPLRLHEHRHSHPTAELSRSFPAWLCPLFHIFLVQERTGCSVPCWEHPTLPANPSGVPCPPGRWGQHGPMAPVPVLGLSIMPNAFLQLLNLLPWARCNFWSNVGTCGPDGLKADLDVSWQPRACSPGCWS